MYELRFNGLLLASGELGQVLKARKVSGDLIYKKGKLVKHFGWLFLWERKDKNCYVQRMINKG